MLKIVAAIEYTINCGSDFMRGRKRAVVYRVLLLNFKNTVSLIILLSFEYLCN